MSTQKLNLLILFSLTAYLAQAQDSILTNLQQIPQKYIAQVDTKIDKYYNRITNKTEKTLEKLAKWENKIKSLLQKASPETVQRLFGNNQLTFTTLLEKYKKGKAVSENYRKQYDEYKDKLSSTLDYLDKQKEQINSKLVKPLKEVQEKIKKLEEQEENTDAVQQFIKQRKKQLLEQSIQYLGKSKYLAKINKDSYYYFETLKNYKEIFQDKKKAEQTALTILNKIPAFQNFFKQNSMLASLFRRPGSSGGGTPNLAGLQTRASMNALIQQRVAAGGPNAQQQIMQNIQAAQQQLQQLKDKIIKAGGNSSDVNLPDFKPNQTKTKTFKQRLEFGSNFQFAKNNSLMPTTADIALNAGYKLNDKSVIGIGASYKLSLGSIQHISFSSEGMGLRTYLDWKLVKQLYMSGGFEMNYFVSIPSSVTTPTVLIVHEEDKWKQSALLGLSKKINIKTKFIKSTKISLLFDFMAKKHLPISQAILFRAGYNF